MTLTYQLRYAIRMLRQNPGFAAVGIITLALGIGASTAMFSVLDGVVLKSLRYPDVERIVAVNTRFTNEGRSIWRSAGGDLDDLRVETNLFESFSFYQGWEMGVQVVKSAEFVQAAFVDTNFFHVFSIAPLAGRVFTADDAGRSAVVSLGFAQRNYGSTAAALGQTLGIGGTAYEITGVLPAMFDFPNKGQVWAAISPIPENRTRSGYNYKAVAKLRDGVSTSAANARLQALGARLAAAFPRDNGDKTFTVIPLQDQLSAPVRSTLFILMGAVGLVLLTACANVANLMLARATARSRELAVRSALGAPRRRLVRQFVTEAFVLSLLGGAFGLLGAYFGVTGLLAVAPQNLPRLDEVSINLPVLAFALLLCCGVAIGVGFFTALRATAGDIRKGLAEGGREQASSQSSQRVGRGIVAAQIAITLVLVVGAGLLGRSLMKLLEVNPGFRMEKIVTMDVSLPRPDWTDWKTKAGQAIFFRNLLDRLRQIPGVRQVGATSDLPMTGWVSNGQFLLIAQNELPKNPTNLQELSRDFDLLFRQKERLGEADFCVATHGYFQSLGIPLLRGRIFDERDGPDSPHAAVISASLARERWPGQDPIGHTIEFGNMDGDIRLLTIIGVVGDVHNYSPDAPPQPTVYVNLFQRPEPQMTLTMLSDADTQQVTSAARQILHELNPEIPPRFRTFSQVYSESLGSRRFNLLLIGFFAGIALLLATAGVFGVMAYSVSRRTREIGVRVALGARPRDVLAMVLGQGLRTVLVGVVLGVAGSLALTRAIQSLLFGITATDPLTFIAVILLLVTVALLACYIPARRAAKVDPMVALRYE